MGAAGGVGASLPNDTVTLPRASSSASKYSRSVNRNIPAISTDGKVWILVLYLKTESL